MELKTMPELFWRYLKRLADIRNDIDTDAAAEQIRRGIWFRGPNVWILAFSIIIASVGLNVNSTAVIIGAMLISPLMGPIIGIGLSLGTNDAELLKNAFRNFLVMFVISLGVNAQVVGSVRELCRAAGEACRSMGYETVFLSDQLNCEAREAGRFLAAILRSHANERKKIAFLAGGETVVHLTGKGKGGRNQELALAACEGIDGITNAAVISVGSDGTDGPTDAAGGYVDGDSYKELCKCGINLHEILQNNDAYHALLTTDGLIVTGPTGTNVNDICIGLLDGE